MATSIDQLKRIHAAMTSTLTHACDMSIAIANDIGYWSQLQTLVNSWLQHRARPADPIDSTRFDSTRLNSTQIETRLVRRFAAVLNFASSANAAAEVESSRVESSRVELSRVESPSERTDMARVGPIIMHYTCAIYTDITIRIALNRSTSISTTAVSASQPPRLASTRLLALAPS